MNLLLSLPEADHGRILTTLNPHPDHPVDPRTIISTQRYAQPVLSAAIVHAQNRLARLQGQVPRHRITPHGVYHQGDKEKENGKGCEAIRTGRVIIAGAWTGRGIHEDGFVSGLLAAERVGARARGLVPVDRPAGTVGWGGKAVAALMALGRMCGWA